MQDIILDRISKSFDGKKVLQDFSATFPAGKVSCIMAPSGGGKTTLLRILMGFETPDSGQIKGLNGLKKSAVFQEDRLCAHLSPIANIRLITPLLARADVMKAMTTVGLQGCEDQPVHELSGGMRRRVAILRALLCDYDILLLDEPFKGLDMETKSRVMQDTARRSAGRTVLLVTHDATEAEAMYAGQIILLENN